MSGNLKAPDGQIWVCGACGKQSRWRYGFDDAGKNCGPSRGWDSSCMTWAILCHETKVDYEGVPGWQAVEPQP